MRNLDVCFTYRLHHTMNTTVRNLLLIGSSAALLAACGKTAPPADPAPAEQTQDASAELTSFVDAEFKRLVLDRSPETQTFLGIKDDYGQWDEATRARSKETLQLYRDSVETLKAKFADAKLNTQAKLSYKLYIDGLADQEADFKWFDYSYPFNQMFGRQSRGPAFLIAQHRVGSEADAVAYIERLEGYKAMMDQYVDLAIERFGKDIYPPKFVYEYVLDDAKNIITGAPFEDGDDSTLLADLKSKVDGLELDDARKAELLARGTAALKDSVKPAYDRVIKVMTEQQAKADTDDGVWKLPKGGAYYAHRLKKMTTTDLTADEIHNIGLSEMDRIHDEMRGIMETVGFDGTLNEFFVFMREDEQFYFADTEEGRAGYLELATDLINNMKGRLDELFITKPKADVVVKPVEAFREKSAGKAFYQRPTPDGSRPGVYYANLYNMAEMPKYAAEALAYHEGVPGHHMQIAIAQELTGVPMFRKFGGYTAYIEGWGLYSEYVPKEIGLYEDPYSDFGRLSLELWRAARLVVDTGLHHKRWTRQEAIDYLVENTPNAERDCVKAIERYIVMPGQATAYKIGMLKILELRKMAKDALGERFDIREFHDVILANGAVPLDVLEDLVETWIKEKSA